jgi:DNA-binding MarR family transcriptional regulator
MHRVIVRMNKAENVADIFLLLFGEMHDKFLRSGEKITRLWLSRAQFRALTHLRRQGPLPISELASELKISKQQTTPLICKLIDSGLVVRKADEHDRRIVRIEITEAGRDTVEELVAEIKQAFAAKLGVLPDADLDELEQMIRRIRKILEHVK